jgi:preprotein translocase subunit SecG
LGRAHAATAKRRISLTARFAADGRINAEISRMTAFIGGICAFASTAYREQKRDSKLESGGKTPLYKPRNDHHSPPPMTFAAINYLSISINLLLVVFVFVCVLMTLVILMQRPKQEGLGAAFGAGVTDQVFGARTTNVLQRGTVYLASAFFILSLTLAILIGFQNRKNSLLAPKSAKPAAEAPAIPAEPEKPKSLTEELPETAPAPVTPATPEAPAPAPEAPAPAAPAPAPEAPAPAPEAPAPAPEAPAPAPEVPAPAPEAPAPAPQAPAPAPESAPAPAPSEKPEGQ